MKVEIYVLDTAPPIEIEHPTPYKPNNNYSTIVAIMSVVGIDFGVKHCVIAAAGRGGVDVILNGNSQRLNP